MGKILSEAAMPLPEWTAENLPHIDKARTRFDSRYCRASDVR
jgi:hypothetical protein